jgi:hypothetical protein
MTTNNYNTFTNLYTLQITTANGKSSVSSLVVLLALATEPQHGPYRKHHFLGSRVVCLFVVMEMCLLHCGIAVAASFCSTIPSFSHHVTLLPLKDARLE